MARIRERGQPEKTKGTRQTKPKRKTEAAPPAAPKPPKPNARTLARAAEAKQRGVARHERASVDVMRTGARRVSIGPPHNDGHAWQDILLDAFGTTSGHFARCELLSLSGSLRNNGEEHASLDALNAALAAVDATRPENEMAAMLAAQMASVHSLAMDMLGRTRRAENLMQLEAFGGLVTKLLRTFTAQTEALAKLKRGGEQIVRVEHVHVHAGGQAIVGPVTHEGGGASSQTQDQSHARQIAHAPVAPMPREIEAERPTVPSASRSRG